MSWTTEQEEERGSDLLRSHHHGATPPLKGREVDRNRLTSEHVDRLSESRDDERVPSSVGPAREGTERGNASDTILHLSPTGSGCR